jgi:hypothetical protein
MHHYLSDDVSSDALILLSGEMTDLEKLVKIRGGISYVGPG